MSDLLSQTLSSNLSEATDEAQHHPSARPPGRTADGHPRHHRREHRPAAHRDGSAHERLDDQLDDYELLADLRKPPALRRTRGRPPWPPSHVPDGPRRLHRFL